METPIVNEPEIEEELDEEMEESDTFYDLKQVLKVTGWARIVSNVLLVAAIIPPVFTIYSILSAGSQFAFTLDNLFSVLVELLRSSVYFVYWIAARVFAEGLTILLDIEHNTRKRAKGG